MARRRRGGLDEEALRLWSQVAASTQPLPGRTAAPPPPAEPAAPNHPVAQPSKKLVPAPIAAFRLGERAATRPATAILMPDPAQQLAGLSLRMDHKTHRRMSRGKVAPEARIDLHGMTLAVAQPALVDFVLRQHAAGRRLILIITGKGRREVRDAPLPVRPGALRHYVPHWLQRAPLSAVVLQVAPAHIRHGGEGAYYVYLRR